MTGKHDGPKQLVVLAGGVGTRLAAATGGLPKALVPVGGIPVLERQVELARNAGIDRVFLLLGHGADEIIAWTESWKGRGVDFGWQVEQKPRGTGGALLDALPQLDRQFLLFFGDQLIDFDIFRLVNHHTQAANEVTVIVHPNDHPYDSDLLELDDAGQVKTLHRPPHAGHLRRNIVNAATYVVERECLERMVVSSGERTDFARDLLPRLIAGGARIGAYRSREYLKDMGTPERLAKVEADLATGVVAGRRVDRPMPAILLDRDGTINVERGRISRPRDIELIEGVADAIKRAHAAGYLVAVVTNQPVVARGDCTVQELDNIHAQLEMLLAESRSYVDAIYVCPHHPDRGFTGEVPHLKGPCRCRKPGTALVEKAVRELNIAESETWLIGDSSSDVACALAAGLIPALVSTGHGGKDGHYPTELALRFPTAADAITFAVEVFPAAWRRCLDVVNSAAANAALRAVGNSDESAGNVARLLLLAALRLGKTASLTSVGSNPCISVDGADGIMVTASVKTDAPSECCIEVTS